MKKVLLTVPAVALLMSGAVSGCAQDPAIAARVDGSTVPVSDVKIFADFLCVNAATEKQPGNSPVIPLPIINATVMNYLIGTKALRSLVRTQGGSVPAVTAPPDVSAVLGKMPAQERGRAQELVNEVSAAASFMVRNLGVQEAQVPSAMASLVQELNKDKGNRLVVNPAYSLADQQTSGSLSTAVSDAAKQGMTGQPSPSYIAGLPSGQTC